MTRTTDREDWMTDYDTRWSNDDERDWDDSDEPGYDPGPKRNWGEDNTPDERDYGF